MHLNPHALRAIRERSGLSLTELARRAGISQPHLSNLERGRRQASPSTVRRLAEALKVPVPALLAELSDAEQAGGADDGREGVDLALDAHGRWPPPRLVVADERGGVTGGRAPGARPVSEPFRGSARRRRSPG